MLSTQGVLMKQKHVLLLGAGFSRNWGGLLATEVFEYLIGLPEIREDMYLSQILWKKKRDGFEKALGLVQAESDRDPLTYKASLKRLQDGVLKIFGSMNNAFFERPTMEFQKCPERMLHTFLAKFDTVFTLNQDVLLEHHYLSRVPQAESHPWKGAQLPGMKRIRNDGLPKTHHGVKISGFR